MQKNNLSVLISILPNEHTEYIVRCFDSIKNQSVKANEVVFVIDGESNDALEALLKKWQPVLNLNIIRLNKNIGLGFALKTGLNACSNELIARVDVDDINQPNRFEIQQNFLTLNANIDVVGSWITEFEDDEQVVSSIRKTPLTHEQIKAYSRYRNPINHMTVMFRKNVIVKHGSYDNLPGFEDYYLWLKLIHNNVKLANIDQYLVNASTVEIGLKRGGLKYIKNETNFIRQAFKHHYLSLHHAFLLLLTRLIFRLFTPAMRQTLYRHLLRNNTSKHM